ncbi:D-lactate dehydrogenase [Maritimibacter alkaliphilus HTCC2654]|uniref:Quinone-dependent D-lactate dehydrogenase n=1 Tax=Maritimibacter alkaliphilus HTCC2654 TaxID=314271 RepID=A3VK24_9RHOB|nr:D-lactate dehydrogenase [Maritimibacter alkaliphilus]EAQ11329.1 D-lactate dehydrogenase [Rhodobacterales bacterium HTCC2654] [Maritimibacter alkaliphilus HTCC2654]TYP80128.1 D-lactate dehydrogenase [Maritimibacter alkaliphilus HTCC2654]
MTQDALVARLTRIVGRRHCLTDPARTARYRKGFRSGEGAAKAVVVPGSLVEMWRVLEAVVAADCIVIMQAANTGLTEGSTPKGVYDRDVVIVSTLRLDRVQLIDGGRQVVSHPGGTLFTLEKMLRPLGRQPHSVIGSSCIGASIVGGVCNNSGGSLVRRGPVYTELSLFARIDAEGRLTLVNHLGIDLGDTPEEMLGRLDRGEIAAEAIRHDAGRASDDGYAARVREIDADTPARFNADPRGLYEASGSAGKVAVFAVRLDTFPSETGDRVFYVGTNDTAAFATLRRRLLSELPDLPVSGEYLHRDCFDISHRYGKDTVLMIHWLGTDRLPLFFALKGRIDGILRKYRWLPGNLTDRVMQGLSRLAPEALPKRMLDFRDWYEHHLILKVSGASAAQTEGILAETVGQAGFFGCTEAEAGKAMLHRFAAAGAAVRYGAVRGRAPEDVLALDIALRRNDADWFETLPAHIADQIEARLYYGHFLCHVLHQDYVVKPGVDPKALKAELLALIDARGAEYPAEHNVGHLYAAKPALAEHYRSLDPTNAFNPGIGKTSREKGYGAACGCGADHAEGHRAAE